MNWPKQVTVKVTQAHIDSGTPACQGSCPIAIALHEIENPLFKVNGFNVGSMHVIGPNCTYILPKIAQVFIEEFDNREHNADYEDPVIVPFEFEMWLENE